MRLPWHRWFCENAAQPQNVVGALAGELAQDGEVVRLKRGVFETHGSSGSQALVGGSHQLLLRLPSISDTHPTACNLRVQIRRSMYNCDLQPTLEERAKISI